MLMQTHDNLRLLHFGFLQTCPGLIHAVSTRLSPCELDPGFDLAWRPGDVPGTVRRRLSVVSRALHVSLDRLCCAVQVHGCSVQCIDEVPEADPGAPCRVCGEHDALITDRPGIMLMIRVADCVPIVLYDPVVRVVALIHAGWKGTAAGIAAATVSRMASRYGCNARTMLAGIGPAIGPCCFEVGSDVAETFQKTSFAAASVITDANGIRVDLPGANRAALLHSGLLPGNIEMSEYCTACSLDIFFSHRGEKGDTGRFGLFAGLRN